MSRWRQLLPEQVKELLKSYCSVPHSLVHLTLQQTMIQTPTIYDALSIGEKLRACGTVWLDMQGVELVTCSQPYRSVREVGAA